MWTSGGRAATAQLWRRTANESLRRLRPQTIFTPPAAAEDASVIRMVSTCWRRYLPSTTRLQADDQRGLPDGESGGGGEGHRFGGVVAGFVAAAIAWFVNREVDEPLPLFPTVLRAAEPSDGRRGSGFGDGSSRRVKYNFIADVVGEVAACLVYIEIKDLGIVDFYTGQPVTASNGSGFIVAEDGLILTNAHVVVNKPNASVQVRLQDGRTFTGVVEDVDVKSDLATIRIPVKKLPVMPLGKSHSVRPGEFVIAMGSPLSLSNTITTGVISTVSRQRAELGLRDRDVPEYIQTDAAITFGNSGGPLVNLDGEAIGINCMKVTPGISFAIPIDYAKEFLAKSTEARKAGRRQTVYERKRRFIGITMLTISPQIEEQLKARLQMPEGTDYGIVVFRVIKGSPADLAGLAPGDIVTHINDSPIHGSSDVYKHLEGNQSLKMRVYRKAKQMQILVKPEVSS